MVNSHIHKYVCSCRELSANCQSSRTGFLAAGKLRAAAHQSAGLILVYVQCYIIISCVYMITRLLTYCTSNMTFKVQTIIPPIYTTKPSIATHAPILTFPTETSQYILDTDASSFGLGVVLSQIQYDVERVVTYCSCALRPSQRRYCTTKREMLTAVAMYVQFWSYLRGAKFTLRTDHWSLVWLHRFKDMEGMMTRWLHALQQFQFSIVHRLGKDHGNADGLSRVPSFPSVQAVHTTGLSAGGRDS